MYVDIYIYIPRTQLTSFFLGSTFSFLWVDHPYHVTQIGIHSPPEVEDGSPENAEKRRSSFNNVPAFQVPLTVKLWEVFF